MTLPLFYAPALSADTIVLDEDTSKHVVGVLRKEVQDQLQLTDGKGTRVTGTITDAHRKRCTVQVVAREFIERPAPSVCIAISLVKNAARFEWFLEKATELGVTEIIPLLCERTEKEKFRADRMLSVINSALLQSQQVWQPVLQEPQPFRNVLTRTDAQKFIAHCLPEEKRELTSSLTNNDALILIGPEGDFTPKEIEAALQQGFQPVSLGNTRLRTETAGMAAAVVMRMKR
jgi:16S rRNA (uracil1498-N3)-methyltransferase